MITKIKGTVSSIFADDINTDDIIPAWTLQEGDDRKFFARYAFSNYDKKFIKRCKKYKENIIVAGENFGCGSSREQAVYALLGNNVVCVIAKSYPDIFFRNAINNGLAVVTLPDISLFEREDQTEIDLEKKTISANGKKVEFEMKEEVAKSIMFGGKTGRVRNDLNKLLQRSKSVRVFYHNTKLKKEKPQTIAEKIISDHLKKRVYAGDWIERLPIDILFFNEVIAPPAIDDFDYFFSDIYKKNGKKVKVFDAKRIFFIPDHTVPASTVPVAEGITKMEKFAKVQNITCYKEGDGIEHVVLIEDGYIVPGEIILGTDSHTDTNGALNTFALGVGTTDARNALATGCLYDFEVPQTIRINISGRFKKGVYPKDLILHLIGQLGVDGASRCVVEFGGEAVKAINMDGKTTIANMAVEMGARTAIFEYDQVLEDYLKDRARFPYVPYLPDKNCSYKKTFEVNLSQLEPQVAFPHKPENVTSISGIAKYIEKSKKSKRKDLPPVLSVKITDAFLGACTNGRYEDFLEAAKVLKGKKVNKDVNFIAIPASRKVYKKLLKEGVLEIFAEAGANIESSNCGPCFGKHMGVVGRNAQMISSSNRNYIGRMGSASAKIFLASPATVAAAAVAGEIVDPRRYL